MDVSYCQRRTESESYTTRRIAMRKVLSLSVAFLFGILGALAPRAASATTPLQYHGGPFLQTFEIYPLYYGNWSATESLLSRPTSSISRRTCPGRIHLHPSRP